MSREFSDMDDKEFDEYLKKASESPDIPFREEDWKQMKVRIAAPSAKAWSSKWWTALAVLGIFGILCLGIYFGGELLLKSSYEEQQEVTARQVLEAEDVEDDMGTSNPTTGKSFPEKGASSQAVAIASDPSGSTAPNSEIGRQGTDVTVFPDSRESRGQNFNPLRENREINIVSPHSQPDLSQLDPLNPGSKVLRSRPVVQVEEQQPEDSKHKKWFAGRFDLSVQAAPDLSGVELNQLGRAGQAVGLGVEYFISPAFSVNSGVYYSHKPYETNGPFGMGYGELVSEVVGDCGVLDIPVNLRYYPLQGAVQRAFVGIGLSSYLMLSETYKLTYQDPATGYEYTKTLEKKGENQHPFGVVNLSVGYERKLAQRLSLQVEPYLKVPLDGVGEGNISLKSTGIFIGLKFYPGR